MPTARRGQIAWCMAPAALAQGEPSGSVTLYAVIDLSVYHKQLAGEKRDRQVAAGSAQLEPVRRQAMMLKLSGLV